MNLDDVRSALIYGALLTVAVVVVLVVSQC